MINRYEYYNTRITSKRRKRRRRGTLLKRIRFALIFLFLLFIVFCSHSLISMGNSLKSLSASNLKISLPSSKNTKNTKDMVNLKAEIGNYLQNHKGEYGVYYYNLTNGDEFGINDGDTFTSASTEKIPINLYLYNRISAGAVDPNGTLTYLQEDYEGGTGTIQYQKVGTRYTVKQLSALSIEDSDNVAANMLIRFLGIQNIKDYMRQVGGTVVVDGQNVSSPKDMGLYMKLVYQFYENNGALGNELMNSFLNTIYNDRINALLPASVKVAHKIGNEVGVVNDVGIVFSDQPYVISIMSKGVDESEAPDVIAHISKMIYDTVSQEK